jgi:hypothetical protein
MVKRSAKSEQMDVGITSKIENIEESVSTNWQLKKNRYGGWIVMDGEFVLTIPIVGNMKLIFRSG